MEESSSKPVSMSDKDWYVKKVAESLCLNVDVVNKVIKHQFESIVAATHKNKTIEMSGFGILTWHDKKALKRLDDLDGMVRAYREKILVAESESDVKNYTDTIDDILIKRQTLINRINELNSDLRGMEKPSSPRGRPKGSRNKNKRKSNGNL